MSFIKHYTSDKIDGVWVDVAGVLVEDSQGKVVFKTHVVFDKDVTPQEKADKLREVCAKHILIDLKQYHTLWDVVAFLSLHDNAKLFQLYKEKYPQDLDIKDMFVKKDYWLESESVECIVNNTIHITEVYTEEV